MASKTFSMPDQLLVQASANHELTSSRICTLLRYGLEVERLAALPNDASLAGYEVLVGAVRRAATAEEG